jgi:hypothetical protein
MTEVGGFELADAMGARPHLAHIPIVRTRVAQFSKN